MLLASKAEQCQPEMPPLRTGPLKRAIPATSNGVLA